MYRFCQAPSAPGQLQAWLQIPSVSFLPAGLGVITWTHTSFLLTLRNCSIKYDALSVTECACAVDNYGLTAKLFMLGLELVATAHCMAQASFNKT